MFCFTASENGVVKLWHVAHVYGSESIEQKPIVQLNVISPSHICYEQETPITKRVWSESHWWIPESGVDNNVREEE